MASESKLQSITIVDIAEKAHVAVSTVSRVINNSGSVSRKTRTKVQKVIDELGYIPNKMAQGFATKKSKAIALIIPDISNPFFADIIHGVEHILNKSGYSMFLCNSNYNPAKETAYIMEMAERRVDGVVIISAFMQNIDLIQTLNRTTMPIVTIQTQIDGIDCVNTCDYEGVYSAITHHISIGHRNIAFICIDTRGCPNRYKAYKDALEANDIPFRMEYVREKGFSSHLKENPGYLMTKELLSLEEPPTAIQTLNDYLAIGAYMAVSEMGLMIPKHVSISGFDDIPLSQLLNPPLTTVSQPGYAMGEASSELLLKVIEDGSGVHREIRLPTHFIVRESTAGPLE